VILGTAEPRLRPLSGERARWLAAVQAKVQESRLRADGAAIVIGAHHDTVSSSPGGDDNAAGVAALLELARALAPYRFRRSLVLAVLDMEEMGFLGAEALVPELLRLYHIEGAIIFETMAYTARAPGTQTVPPGIRWLYPGQVGRIRRRHFTGDFTAVLYNGPALPLARGFAEGLTSLAGPDACVLLRAPGDLPVVGPMLKAALPVVPNFARSDHVVFWQRRIAALQVTDTADFRNPHYHLPTDTLDTLDYERLAAIVGATAVTLAEAAGLLPGSG
jgi:Zn-dependent M28 family amino/carboxypeptidase